MIPKLIAGCEQVGSVLPDALVGRSERAASLAYLDGVREAGYTAFDLAAAYRAGGTERLFGHWLRTHGRRDQLFLIGKGGHPYPLVKPNRLHVTDVDSDLHASLRRLGTPYFDMYLLHRDHPEADLVALAHWFARVQSAGLVRAFGVSNWTHQRIAAFNSVATREGLPRLSASSPQWSLATWTKPQFPGCVSISGDATAQAFYTDQAMPVLAWSPLGRGFFNGMANPVYDTPVNHARRDRVRELASRHGTTPTTVALAYVLSQPCPSHAIVAARTVDKMRRNWDAARLGLTRAECRWLETGLQENNEPPTAQSS